MKKLKNLNPENFEQECTTVWSFKEEEIGQLINQNIEETGLLKL